MLVLLSSGVAHPERTPSADCWNYREVVKLRPEVFRSLRERVFSRLTLWMCSGLKRPPSEEFCLRNRLGGAGKVFFYETQFTVSPARASSLSRLSREAGALY